MWFWGETYFDPFAQIENFRGSRGRDLPRAQNHGIKASRVKAQTLLN